VTPYALKPVTPFPPRKDVRHDSQEIPFHRTSRKIDIFEKTSRYSCHESIRSNANCPSKLRNMDFSIVLSSNQYVEAVSTMTRIYAG